MRVRIKMLIFVCTDHEGHYPVGVASVVIARSKTQARKLLDKALVKNNLNPKAIPLYKLRVIGIRRPRAIILKDGDY